MYYNYNVTSKKDGRKNRVEYFEFLFLKLFKFQFEYFFILNLIYI